MQGESWSAEGSEWCAISTALSIQKLWRVMEAIENGNGLVPEVFGKPVQKNPSISEHGAVQTRQQLAKRVGVRTCELRGLQHCAQASSSVLQRHWWAPPVTSVAHATSNSCFHFLIVVGSEVTSCKEQGPGHGHARGVLICRGK